MTSGHPPLPPALVLACHLGWPGGQASAAVVARERCAVGFERRGRSGPGSPRRPERTGRELSRGAASPRPSPWASVPQGAREAHLPLELGKLRPGGQGRARVTQHPWAPSSSSSPAILGSCSLGGLGVPSALEGPRGEGTETGTLAPHNSQALSHPESRDWSRHPSLWCLLSQPLSLSTPLLRPHSETHDLSHAPAPLCRRGAQAKAAPGPRVLSCPSAHVLTRVLSS